MKKVRTDNDQTNHDNDIGNNYEQTIIAMKQNIRNNNDKNDNHQQQQK